eukprot:COSAG03_NODE_8729_length_775_cov_1.920118_1_plen_20_part_10
MPVAGIDCWIAEAAHHEEVQ